MFKALGILDKVKLSYLSPDAGAQQLKDGHIDAALAPGSPFPSSWVELARSTPVRLIEPTKDEAEKIGMVMTLWAVSGPEFGPTVKMGIPIHPGAAKYWMEKGVKLPPELLK